MSEDWAAVAHALDARMTDLGMTQQELADRAQVSSAIVRELHRNTAQRRRNARTLEALSVTLGWHPGHLHAVVRGDEPPDTTAAPSTPTDVVAGRLGAIEGRLRSIEALLVELRDERRSSERKE